MSRNIRKLRPSNRVPKIQPRPAGARNLRVHAVSYYRSAGPGWPAEWRDIDVEIWDLLAALRNEKQGAGAGLDSYEVRVWDGRTRTFSDRAFDQQRAVAFAARRLLILMKKAGYDGASIVPIPSTTHVAAGAPFLGEQIARAIEARDPRFRCRPVLSFAQPLPRTSQGGRRTATAVRVNLRSGNLGGLGRVILIDDIMTSGAHMRGAATFLRDKGVAVDDGFVMARTADAPPEDMMKVETIELRL